MQHANAKERDWEAAVSHAVAQTIETHRRLGHSIVVWQDGKPTWLAPEDIPPLRDKDKNRQSDKEI